MPKRFRLKEFQSSPLRGSSRTPLATQSPRHCPENSDAGLKNPPADGRGMRDLAPCYSQYCHWPIVNTYTDKRQLVTACASMQSARFRVWTIHQL